MSRDSSGLEEAINIIDILRRIPRNRRITAGELRESMRADGVDISIRTMQRTLKALSECGRLGVECDARERPYGYRRTYSHSDLGLDSMTPSESLLLRIAEERLRYQLPATITRGLEHLYDEAKALLDEGKAGRRKQLWQQKVLAIPAGLPQLAAVVKPRIFEAVSEALYRDAKLNLTYTNNEGKTLKVCVAPLGLVQQDTRLYLVCRFDGFDNYRHLALHRIQGASLSDDTFSRPKDFSLSAYVSGRHFNYSNGEKVRWIVDFENEATARNLKETPFNNTQKLTKTAQGLWRLAVEIEDSIWLDGWVAAYQKIAGIQSATKSRIVQTKQSTNSKDSDSPRFER